MTRFILCSLSNTAAPAVTPTPTASTASEPPTIFMSLFMAAYSAYWRQNYSVPTGSADSPGRAIRPLTLDRGGYRLGFHAFQAPEIAQQEAGIFRTPAVHVRTATSATRSIAAIDLNEEELWSAVQNRDASRDGEFFYGVMTTGVYCRPSCASRRPLRKNVRFFATTEEAEAADLRACKRCRPTGASANVFNQVVHELARQIEAQPEQTISLEQLAKRAGYSPFHLQRSFKAIIGSSPKEYQTAARVRMLKKELRNEAPVADAIYQAGFGSGSRVYEKADGQLGMTPSEYRSGGKGPDDLVRQRPNAAGIDDDRRD